jgi:hypothetical protein
MLLKKVLIVRFLKLFPSIFLYGFNTLTLVDFYTAKTQQIYTGVILLKRSTLMTRNPLISIDLEYVFMFSEGLENHYFDPKNTLILVIQNH